MIARGRKHSDDYFNTANGCISAEYAMPVPGNLVDQIRQIKEAFPDISKENVAIVFQSCDCNLEKAMSMLSQDGGAAILSSWSLQGKKGKNGQSRNNRKKNRKNKNRQQSTLESKKNDITESSDVADEGDTSKQVTEVASSSTNGDVMPDREADPPKPPPSIPKSSTSKHLESDNNPPKSLPQTVEKVKSTRTTTGSSKVEEPTKKESNVIDSMRRSSKDLQRSAVALSRFHTKHEEKCNHAEKSIKSQFSKMRESIVEREKFLLEELEKVKVEAARLLNERQDQAAHLQMQCNQVVRLPNDEIQELRAEIKLFVGDRKIDEELATSDRFIGNCQDIVEAIGKFGQINPLRTDYKPRTAALTPQVSTEGDKITRDNVHETSVDGLKAKDQTNSKPARVENGAKSISYAELKERVEAHSKLVEAVHEQAAKGVGKVSTDSHEEHSKSEVGDRNIERDRRVVEDRSTQVAEKRTTGHETNFSGNRTSTKQLKAQNEEKSFDQRQSHQPPRPRNGRQNNRRDRRNQGTRHRDNDEWNFFDGSNDSASLPSSQRLNDKRAQRPFEERPDHRQERTDHRQERADYRQERADHRQEKADHRQERPDHRQERPDHRQEKADHRQERPDHRQERPDHRQERPDHRQERPDHRQERADHRQERADHRQERADLRQERPDHRQERADHRQERPDHRHWRRNEDVSGRRKSAREERSSDSSVQSHPIRQDDPVVVESKNVDTKQDVRESGRESLRNSVKSSSKARSIESFKDQNNNITRDIDDLSKTDRNKSGKGSKDFEDRVERHYSRKERRAPGSRGNNYHRSGGEFHRYQNPPRQNHKGAFIEEVSSSENRSKDDRKRTVPNGQDVESNAVLTKEKQEKRGDEKDSKARQTEGREDHFVESTVVEKAHRSNDTGKIDSHDQQRRSPDKSEKPPEHLPQKKNTTQRNSRRSSHSDRYREYNGYKHDRPPRMKYSSQRVQRNERVGDESKKAQANTESNSGQVPEKGTVVASKSWADEVLQENSVKCNGHAD